MASERQPRQGETVIFIPRVPYGRQDRLTAWITRVWDAEKGDIDIVFFSGQEHRTLEHVSRASAEVKLHCWEFVGADDPATRLAALEELTVVLQSDVRRLVTELRVLQGRVVATSPTKAEALQAAGTRKTAGGSAGTPARQISGKRGGR